MRKLAESCHVLNNHAAARVLEEELLVIHQRLHGEEEE